MPAYFDGVPESEEFYRDIERVYALGAAFRGSDVARYKAQGATEEEAVEAAKLWWQFEHDPDRPKGQVWGFDALQFVRQAAEVRAARKERPMVVLLEVDGKVERVQGWDQPGAVPFRLMVHAGGVVRVAHPVYADNDALLFRVDPRKGEAPRSLRIWHCGREHRFGPAITAAWCTECGVQILATEEPKR